MRVHTVIAVFEILEPVVVGVARKVRAIDGVELLGANHPAKIPKLHGLVLGIGEHVAAVAFAVNVSDTFCVAEKRPSFPTVTHTPSIPDLQSSVVGARVEDVRGGVVAKANSIDIFLVAIYAEDSLSSLDIVDVYAMVASAGNQFPSISGETDGPDLDSR